MPDQPQLPSVVKPGSLTANVHQAVSKELTTFVENGVITPEEQAKLTTAISSASALGQVATPIAKRSLGKIESLLAIRQDTGIGRAREALINLSEGWSEMRSTWHQHRQMFFDVRLRGARIKAKRAEADQAKDDLQREVLGAEADLMQAEMDAKQSELAEAVTAMQSRVQKLNDSAASYALVCKEAGKETFTEADFQADEVKSYLSMAWWHVAHTFKEQHKYVGPGAPPLSRVVVQRDALAFFKAIGLPERTIQEELARLADERRAFDMAHGNQPQSFSERFDQWTLRMSDKYLPAAAELVSKYGIERFRRAAAIMDPDPKDVGKGLKGWEDQERGGMFQ